DAELSWEGFNMSQWQVQYKRDGESQYTSFTVDEPTLTLTGLQHSTTYNVRVRSICGGSYSDFAELDITTECTIVREFPFVENFDGETFPPLCWSQERTAAGSGAGLGYANGAWMRSASVTGDNSTPKAMLADAKAGSVHNLASIGIMFAESLNGYDVSLDVYRSATSEASAEEGVEVWVNSYPDIVNGNPQMLGFVSKNYQVESDGVDAELEPGWYNYSFNTRGLVGISYVILVGKANNAGGVYVDNLKVEKTVDCLAPGNLVVESEGENNVVLTWSDANAVQGTWTVRYSLDGGDEVETSVDEPQLTITGLQAGVTYSILAEIQGVCAAGMESDWYSTTIEATTNCLPLDLPYSENFDVADGTLPDCWKSAGDGNMVWSVSNGAVYKPTGSRQSVTHLLSPSFNFNGEKYLLEFDVKQSSLSVSQPDMLYVQFVTETRETIGNVSIQNAAENGMSRISVAVPQYSGIAHFDFVLDGYRECTIDSVVVRLMNREADILTFEIPEQTYSEINAETAEINVGVVYGTDLTALSPIFTISEKASVDVASGELRDFSSPVVYVVTAEDADYTRE
ncbi:MAG: fibronectin type III domain-containing protein, partial [Bacteroidales bacterium]|nr:fibronectin type III domain-containing protein [Bacteroidales bacterium]